MTAYYSLFMRNWLNGRATEAQIDQAVVKGFLTEEEATEIKNTEK